jgi:beta-lactamase superfamily II metal-dependent hydrolase
VRRLLLVLLLLVGCAGTAQSQTGTLEVHFIDVGQVNPIAKARFADAGTCLLQ